MFWTRLASGIVLVALMIAAIVPGGAVTVVFFGLAAAIGLFEYLRVFKLDKGWTLVLPLLGTAAMYIPLAFGVQTAMPALAFSFMALAAVFVLTWDRYKADEILLTAAGILYVPFLFWHIPVTRLMPDGRYLVWLIFLSAWGCDTCAYCVGMLIGKHKLTPKLSPKKSVEGAVGGIVGAGLLGLIFGLIFAEQMPAFRNPAVSCAIICAAGGILSQVGDLTASGIKRSRGIKDYGKLIPGHGGILDRFDSILFTAPVICYLAELLAM